MKRVISFIIAFTLIVTLCGCQNAQADASVPETTISEEDAKNYKVPNPMEYPDYTFEGTPTTDQLRQTAVQAMRDLLSIQWCTPIEIAYYKTGPVDSKRFNHKPLNTYGGTIYSNASTGLFQFMEYYNFETGMLEYPYKMSQLQHDVGNSCADSLLWGWSSVCNSISGGFYPVNMVHKNGYLPVGGYTYNYNISSYNECPSYTIIEFNGEGTIYNAYTHVQPADALVSTSGNHAMMVIEPPTVVYREDGSINPAESFIVIQDQRGGDGAGFYNAVEDGNVIRYSGRIRHECSFEWLISKHYIPVTAAEFTGEKAYDTASVSVSQDCSDLTQLKDITVSSNYPLAVIRVVIEDENGQRNILGRELFSGAKETGVPTSYLLGYLECLNTFAHSPLNQPGNIIKIEVITSTGEAFTPIELAL